MHSSLWGLALVLAVGLRLGWQPMDHLPWHRRWQRALVGFCVPPMLLLSTAIAVMQMGHHGRMLGLPVSQVGCWLALALGSLGLGLLGWGLGQVGLATWRVRQLPWVTLANGERARWVDSDGYIAARVGLWNPDLVVSRAVIEQLSDPQLEALCRHEQAHLHYRDTALFFALGWLRRLTGWLPRTQVLWQELTLLREIRADRWACQTVAVPLLADTILQLALGAPPPSRLPVPAVAVQMAPGSVVILRARLNALLALPADDAASGSVNWAMPSSWFSWALLGLGLVPLGTVLLHH